MESRMEAYLNAAISENTENLPNPISRIDFLLCELIKTLGESGASIEEVEKIVTDKVAEIVADAPEDFNTLKELSDWIYTHEESAAAMNTAIQSKVDKEEGKSLISDSEITRLANVKNYDDTQVRADISSMNAAVKNDIAINRTTLGTQCKNLLKNTAVTKTVNGVTFTVNSDGSITAKQTTTAPGNATIDVATNITLNPGTYILTGDDEIKKSGYGEIRFYVGSTVYSTNTAHTFDTEVTITVKIFIWQGVNINGSKTIYPMLRYADITDDTYEPYKESVDERLINNTSDIAINKSTLGYQRKNLLKPTSSKTRAGITYTVNEDGSVTLTGASTTGSTYNYFSIPITLKPGKYKVNGMPETSKTTTYRADLRATESGGTAYGYGVKEFEVEFTEITTAYYMIRIDSSYKESLDGITFYPMIRYADIVDDTYEPYSDSVDERILENKSDIVINKTTLGYQRKNLFDWKNANVDNSNNATYTKTDTYITVTSTGAWGRVAYKLPALKIGTKYTFSAAVPGLSQASATAKIRIAYDSEGTNKIVDVNLTKGGEYKAEFTPTKSTIYVLFYPNYSSTAYTNSFTASDIMLRYADIIDDTYEPYQPSVQEQIAALEARIAALEV